MDDGDLVGPPDFIGIGVQKAGTSWWYDVIASHPQVHQPRRAHKERHFFDRTGLASDLDTVRADYARLFPRPVGMRCGEWTPRYLALPWFAAQVETVAPQARLLVILRDPMHRLASGLAHILQRGGEVDSQALLDAVERGRYGAQLRHLLTLVDPARLLCLDYDALVADPPAAYRRTCEHLGLDEAEPPGGLRRAVNATTVAKPVLPDPLRAAATAIYAEDRRVLADLGLDLDTSGWDAL